MTIREFLVIANKAFVSGEIQPDTEMMVAVPGDLRAWPTYGAHVLKGTPTDPELGNDAVPILVIVSNLTDEEETDGEETDVD